MREITKDEIEAAATAMAAKMFAPYELPLSPDLWWAYLATAKAALEAAARVREMIDETR